VLLDDQKRQMYDQYGEAGVKRGMSDFGDTSGFQEVYMGDFMDQIFGGKPRYTSSTAHEAHRRSRHHRHGRTGIGLRGSDPF
jgi:DnaJ-class molecular chaperone